MNTSIIKQAYTYIDQHDLIPSGSSVLIGISGGPDSVFLLHCLAQLQTKLHITIYAAHLDHEWRKTSHKDLEMCKQMCDELGIQLFHAKASDITIASAARGSWEAHGRLLRRSYFESLQHKHNIDQIALAHHKDDQRETFFIRLLRGAGLTGLAGIAPRNGAYIHPLLDIEKQDIYAYLDAHNIHYIADPTNESDAMLRNRIRKHLLPALYACDKRAYQSLDRTMEHLQDADAYLQEHISQVYDTYTYHDDATEWLHIQSVQNAHTYLRRQIILRWLIKHNVPFTPTASLFQELERFFNNIKSKQHNIHPEWGVRKDKGYASVYHVT